MTFKQAVTATPHLGADACRPGFQALAPADRPRVECADTRSLCGSVNIDGALRPVLPDAHRWDYAICYTPASEVVYWVEVHPAATSGIAEVQRKFIWLKGWLAGDGRELRNFDSQYVWIASGKTTFTQTAPQIRNLAQQGLRAVGRVLRIS